MIVVVMGAMSIIIIMMIIIRILCFCLFTFKDLFSVVSHVKFSSGSMCYSLSVCLSVSGLRLGVVFSFPVLL